MRSAIAAITTFFLVAGVAADAHAQDTSSGGMQSPFAFGLGLFLTGVGTAGLAVGGHFYSSGADSCDDIPTDQIPTGAQIDECISGANQQIGGIVSMVTGGAFVIAGVPVMIMGALPEERNQRVIVQVEPGGGSLKVEF